VGEKKRGMKISNILLLALIMMTAAQPALACQVLTYETALEEADIIFTGSVEKITNLPETDGMKPADVTLNVTHEVKGNIPKTIVIRDVGDSCYGAPQFKVSEEYLIFAIEKDGGYKTFHPLPNTLAADEKAQDFIESLHNSNTSQP
jgi:hypothetical protein